MEQYKNVLILGATGVPNGQGSFGLGAEIARAFLASSRPWKVSILARESTSKVNIIFLIKGSQRLLLSNPIY